MSEPVHNPQALAEFMQAAESRRVSVAGIGDSNQFQSGTTGWRQGVEWVLHQRFGTWGTGLHPFPGRDNWASSQNAHQAQRAGIDHSAEWNASAAPSALTASSLDGVAGAQERRFGFLADGQSFSSSFPDTNDRNAMAMFGSGNARNMIDLSRHLRWHLRYGTFPKSDGEGVFRPATRIQGTFSRPVVADPVNPSDADEYGMTDHVLNLPAGSVSADVDQLNFEITPLDNGSNDNPIEGPLFFSYQQIEDVAIGKGVAYQTLLFQGGQSARNAALSLQAATEAQLGDWLRQVTKLQAGDPMLLLQVKHGGNDRNDSNQSVGPSPAPSNTPEGFADNLHAIYNEVRSAWLAEGFAASDLFILFGAYHPQQGDQTIDGETKSKEEWLELFYDAAANLSDGLNNAAALYGNRLISAADMDANGWYHPDGDAHLTQAGYEGFAALEFDAIADATEPLIVPTLFSPAFWWMGGLAVEVAPFPEPVACLTVGLEDCHRMTATLDTPHDMTLDVQTPHGLSIDLEDCR